MKPNTKPKKFPCPIDTGYPGISCTDFGPGHRGKRYLFRVYDERSSKVAGKAKHKNKSYADYDAGLEESRKLQGKFLNHQAQAGKLMMAPLVPLYVDYLKTEGDKATHISRVKFGLAEAVAGGVTNLLDPNLRHDAKRFIDNLMDGRKRKYVAPVRASQEKKSRYVTMLRSFGQWLIEIEGLMPYNPFMAVPKPKHTVKRRPGYLVDEARKIASDQALILPMGRFFIAKLYLGQRLEEMMWLRWTHFMWNAKRVAITLPDKKDIEEARRLGVPVKDIKPGEEHDAILLDELSEIMKPGAKDTDDYVWPEEWRKMPHWTIYSHYKSFISRLTIDRRNRTIHSLRTTNACLMIGSGYNTTQLRPHLGHADETMSAHYAHDADRYTEECANWNKQFWLRRPLQSEGGRGADCKPNATPPGPQQRTGTDNAQVSEDEEIVIEALAPAPCVLDVGSMTAQVKSS